MKGTRQRSGSGNTKKLSPISLASWESRKGQYLLPMIVLVMVLVGMLYIYYSSTTQVIVYRQYEYKPMLGDQLVKYKSELEDALRESVFLGDNSHINGVIGNLTQDASERGQGLVISCTNGSSGNLFWLACSMNLTSQKDFAYLDFNYTYLVPFEIRTFQDSRLASETDYFYKGDTVYFLVTGNNSDVVDVKVLDPYGRVYTNWTTALFNWHWNSSFVPSISGNWTIVANDTNTSVTTEKVVHVNLVTLEMKVYNSQGIEQTDFYPGETFNVSVWLHDLYNQALNCSVSVAIANPLDKLTYGFQTNATNGFASGLVTISPWEIPGNMSVIATEHCYYSQDEANITVLGTYWDRFIRIIPPRMKYNKNHSSVFGDSCGYTDWYASNETSYGSPPNEIPFYVENESASDTLLVNQTTITIDAPNANISWIHFLGSKRVVP